MATYLKLTTKFTDDETRNITLGELAPTSNAVTNFKANVIAFNNPTTRANLYPMFDNSFVSSNGAPFSEITAAEIITTTRTYFNV